LNNTRKLPLTQKMKDYLVGISEIEEKKPVARVGEIADILGVKGPSAHVMVKMLAERKLVNYEKYGYVNLTKKGQEIAKDLTGRKPKLPDSTVPKKTQLLAYIDYPTFVLYDYAFLDDPEDKYIFGHGFFRGSRGKTFLYRIDYDRKYQKQVTLLALQMARDEGNRIDTRLGDVLEWENLSNVEKEGDEIYLTKDAINLAPLAAMETRIRKAKDPYGEKFALLFERGESKNW